MENTYSHGTGEMTGAQGRWGKSYGSLTFSLLGISAVHAVLLLLPVICLGSLHRAIADPAVWILIVATGGWCLGEAAATTGNQQRSIVHDSTTMLAALLCGVVLLGTIWLGLTQRIMSATTNLETVQFFAAGLLIVGVVLRWVAIRTLGSDFVTEIRSRPGRSLVRHGVYLFVRHPSETGILAISVGASLLTASGAALLVSLALLAPLVLWRVRREDRHLARVHGPAFYAHQSQVAALVPWVF